MFNTYAKRILAPFQSKSYQTLNRIEIDRSRTLHNLALVQRQHPGFEIIPVLKGNAYGHGIASVAEVLKGSPYKLLAVDGYFEAARICTLTNHQVLVMGHILPANANLLDTQRCSFVVQDVEGLHALGGLDKPLRVHLELNTGMNRLGLQPEELPFYLEVLRSYPKLELAGAMTHLADADNEADETYNARQVKVFDEQVKSLFVAGFKPRLIHIAQTAGSPKIRSRYANAIRFGIGTYGINPLLPNDPHYHSLADLRPVLELKSTIIKTLELNRGDKVSYNCIFTAPREMRIGVLPLGYYEGLPRELSNKGCVTYGDQELPIVGRICMNHTMIDLKDTALQANDQVTVISKDPSHSNSVAGMQRVHGLFSYTTLTGLSVSVRREIV